MLVEALAKRFTDPAGRHGVAEYADWLDREAKSHATAQPVPDTSSRTPVAASALADRTGVYRDPWFGDVDICPNGDGVRFASRKSPLLTGRVMRVGDRLLVEWQGEGTDAEPWLHFGDANDGAKTMTLSKVDPDADFSNDFEDLAFTRVGDCARR